MNADISQVTKIFMKRDNFFAALMWSQNKNQIHV